MLIKRFLKLLRRLLWRDIFWFLVGKLIRGKEKLKTSKRDQSVWCRDKMPEAHRHSKRHGKGFAGPVGHSANLETGRSFLQGSWHLCTPPPSFSGVVYIIKFKILSYQLPVQNFVVQIQNHCRVQIFYKNWLH